MYSTAAYATDVVTLVVSDQEDIDIAGVPEDDRVRPAVILGPLVGRAGIGAAMIVRTSIPSLRNVGNRKADITVHGSAHAGLSITSTCFIAPFVPGAR